MTDQECSQGYSEVKAFEVSVNGNDNDGYELVTDDQDGYEEISDDETFVNKNAQDGHDQGCDDDASMNIKEIQNIYDQVCEEEEPNEDEDEQNNKFAEKYNVEPYFSPASEEEQIMMELERKLEVTMIPKENVKYV